MGANSESEFDEKRKIDYAAVGRMLFPLMRPIWWAYALCVLFALAIAALTVTEPYIYGRVIDAVTASVASRATAASGFAAIIPFLFGWAGVVLGETLLTAVFVWTGWYIGNVLERNNQKQVFAKMLTLGVSRFHDERAGALLNRFTAGDEALWSSSNAVTRVFLQSACTLALVLIVGFALDWRLTLAALVVIPVNVGIGFWHMFLSLHRQNKLQEKWDETSGIVGDAFSNITTVQGSAGERGLVNLFIGIYDQVLRIQYRVNVSWAGMDAATNGITVAGRLIIFVVGIRLVLSGSATLGTLIMFLGFAGFLYGNIQTILSTLPEFARSLNRLGRLARTYEEIPEVVDRPKAKPAPALRGGVVLDNVWFGYKDSDKSVLRAVSVEIPAGQTFAVIGESGAGKSTLAKLMVRFADPTKGAIRVDGVDLRDMTLATLRPQIGFVMQENMLFHESISYNLKFAKPNATREEIVAAARRAQAHEFISKLPKGYDTVVGERGVKLSGGQKQRIALARVLLANPPILVLDEATSALDSKTEHDLQAALREVMKNRTTIVIAHRLSTVMDADNILVMDRGRIVDQGTHDQLIRRDNLYKKFWEIQAGGYV